MKLQIKIDKPQGYLQAILFAISFGLQIHTFSQNDYNNYQDFNQATVFPDYSPEKMKNYWGEYQWFLFDTLHHWQRTAQTDSISYKIETVSYPFIANHSRTIQAGIDTFRILTVPSQYIQEKDEWIASPRVKRINQNKASNFCGNVVNETFEINE